MAAAIIVAALLVVGYQMKVQADERERQQKCLAWQEDVRDAAARFGEDKWVTQLVASGDLADVRPERCPIP